MAYVTCDTQDHPSGPGSYLHAGLWGLERTIRISAWSFLDDLAKRTTFLVESHILFDLGSGLWRCPRCEHSSSEKSQGEQRKVVWKRFMHVFHRRSLRHGGLQFQRRVDVHDATAESAGCPKKFCWSRLGHPAVVFL